MADNPQTTPTKEQMIAFLDDKIQGCNNSQWANRNRSIHARLFWQEKRLMWEAIRNRFVRVLCPIKQ
jgi:hypothetical protein